LVQQRESPSSPSTRNVKDLLVVTCEEVFRLVFGNETTPVLLKLIETAETGETGNSNSSEVFSSILHGILGSGAVPVERLILRRLYEKFGLLWEYRKDYGFSNYVQELELNEMEKGLNEAEVT
jgi:hypothetical protein